jgi:tRNA A37 N6-isopentenylltransferase MiaA
VKVCRHCWIPQRAAKAFITCERKELVRRIEKRFATMIQAGVLDEVRRLAARGLDPTLPAMKAHGVPWLIRHLGRRTVPRRSNRGGCDGYPALRETPAHLVS